MGDAPSPAQEHFPWADIANAIAGSVGWGVIITVCLAAAVFSGAWVIARFPARFNMRRTFETSLTTKFGSYPMHWWVGLSGRGGDGPQWFLGFQIYGRLGEEPRNRARVSTRKDGASQQKDTAQ